MKRILIWGMAVVVSVLFAGAGSAAEMPGRKTPDEKAKSTVTKKDNGPPRTAGKTQNGSKRAPAAGKNQDAAGRLASHSKQQHDAARQTIDNLK